MQKLTVAVSIIVCCLFVGELHAQQIKMPVYESLATEFDHAKLEGKWIVVSVEMDVAEIDARPKYAVGDAITLSADANIGSPMLTGGGPFEPNKRAAGSTWMRKIEPLVFPKQIDIVVELENVVAHYRDDIIPQEKQLEHLGETIKVLNGIYRTEQNQFGEQELIWCFSKCGIDRPDGFVVRSGSGRTMVTLKQAHNLWASSIVSNDFQYVAEK